jgi:hypothetical protein
MSAPSATRISHDGEARARRLRPDDGALHLDIREMLEANGWTDTPENREMLTRAAHDVFRAANPDVKIEDV